MQTDSLAQVYARSLYELADEAGGQKKILEIAEEIRQICALARADRKLAEFFASPIIERRARGAALSRIFQDKITDLTLRFLLVVNRKGRLGHLEAINTAYDQLVDESRGRIDVDVYTAAPLSEKQLRHVSERIRHAIDKEPVLHTHTDQSMLGGLKLRIADQLIDGSIVTSLRRMKESLIASGSSVVRQRFDQIINEGGET